MPKADPIKNNFVFGEISQRYKGQPDSDIYRGGVDYLKNYFVSPHGAIYRRGGTKWLAECTSGTASSRLFAFSIVGPAGPVPFILEFYENAFHVRTASGATHMTSSAISTGIPASSLYLLRLFQVGRFIVLLHPTYGPGVITTSTTADWTLTSTLGALSPTGSYSGPYMPYNLLDTGLSSSGFFRPSGTGPGSITLTWHFGGGPASLFTSSWIGRQIRLFDSSSNWRKGVITSLVDATQVNFTIQENALADATDRTVWALGLWSGATGYPNAGCFFQGRLFIGGAQNFPDRIDASRQHVFSSNENLSYFEPNNNVSPTAVDDTSGFDVSCRTKEVNHLRWLDATDYGVIAGTTNGDFVIESENGVMTPTSVGIRPFSRFSNGVGDSLRVDKTIIAVNRSRANITESRFIDRMGGIHAREVPFLDEFLTLPDWENSSSVAATWTRGITQLAQSFVPDGRLWILRSDGVVLSCYIVNNEQQLILAPSRFELGGTGGVSGAEEPKIVSLAAFTSDIYDVVPMIVQRMVNGTSKFFIEAWVNDVDPTFALSSQFFLDCYKYQIQGAIVSAITKANPGVVTTSSAHGFSNGDRVTFRDVFGMTELNNNTYQVANSTATTFELNAVGGGNTNTSAFGTFAASANSNVNVVLKKFNTMSGLSHLNGETLRIFADGQDRGTAAVSGGSISLGDYYAQSLVGYWFNSQCRLLKQDFGSATGTALGKTQRVHRVGFEVDRVVDFQVGGDFTTLHSVRASATTLFSGTLTTQTRINYELGNRVCIQQQNGYPGTILAVMPSLHTEDR